MNDTTDHELDDLLTRHLHAQLDGQLGRIAVPVDQERRPHADPCGVGFFAVHRRRIWSAAAALTTGAAVAATWFLLTRPNAPATTDDRPMIASTSSEVVTTADLPPIVESAAWSRVVDDGPAIYNDRPVRRLRRSVVQEIEWYDPASGATVRQTIPTQQFILVGMKTD